MNITVFLFCFVALIQTYHCNHTKDNEKTNEINDNSITKFMKFFHVIPDVLSEGPKNFLMVTYDNCILADKGVELTPTQVQNQPIVTWLPVEMGIYYTLLLTDADSTDKDIPKHERRHWLVANIPDNDISKGEVLASYCGPTPSEGSGLHRYVFLLYQQTKKLNFEEDQESAERGNFSTQKFTEKYSLGVPIAGNFFQAQYESGNLHKIVEINNQLNKETETTESTKEEEIKV